MVLKPSVRVENSISPFVLVGEKGRILSCWEKNVFEKSYKSFFCCVLTAKFQSLIYTQAVGKLDWMSVSQSHKSPAESE